MTGIPGISSYQNFATAAAIKGELMTMGGNLLNLNSTFAKLTNGDDSSRPSLDSTIGNRTVRRVSARKIGNTVSSTVGGLGPKSTPARTANILGNPYRRRYEPGNANGTYTNGLPDAPAIGQYYDVYESEQHRLRFMDDTVGRDLFGYTHLIDAAEERSGSQDEDKLYLRSTYSIFENLDYPFDGQDIESFEYGPKRYSPSDPYVLKPLENPLVRRALDGTVQGFQGNFEAYMPGREPYRGSLLDMWDYMGSHVYLNLLNGVMEHGLYVENYDMEPRHRVSVYDQNSVPQSDYPYFLNVDTMSPTREIKGLINKTNRMFYEGKIKSLANRFATLTSDGEGIPGFLNTATDHLYGLSRGRNLRKLDLTNENGYPNPYCRVWTTHYQYSKYKHLIRGKWDSNNWNGGNEHVTLHEGDQLMRPNKGYERLKAMTSLDTENGRPIFAPYYVNDRSKMEENSIKRCMFSIENLAWKDIVPEATNIRREGGRITSTTEIDPVTGAKKTIDLYNAKGFGMTLTKEQRGPNGGRIMWFPPYNLKFSEQLHTQWNDNSFIGRGEKVYSYVNSERTGTLSFSILVDHPSIINEWARGGKMGKTGNKANPLSKDEMILRYFAGCDSLEFKPRGEYDVPYSAVTTELKKTFQKDVPVTVPGEKITRISQTPRENQPPEITFNSVFYFPNNYACEDFNKGRKGSDKERRHTEALEVIFSSGTRTNGTVGYEMNNGSGVSGMNYNDTYYVRCKNKNGKMQEWYYPVDTRVQDEVLRNKNAYHDITDFGLNANGGVFGSFWSKSDIENKEGEDFIKYLNNGNPVSENKNREIAKGLIGCGEDDIYFVPGSNFFENLEAVITKLNAASNNSYEYSIDIEGYASQHGYSTDDAMSRYTYNVLTQEEKRSGRVRSNEILAENRAAVIEGWIRELGVFDFAENGNGRDTISHHGNGRIQDTADKTESDFKPKAARVALVKLHIKPSKTVYDEVQTEEDTEKVVTVKNDVTVIETGFTEIFDTSKSTDAENQTYDDEYAYFKQINEEDDMVKRYISDKIDYFDPAFHSITPEGFNARLTFLQQCTRQGPTLSATDTYGGGKYGAGNLSFGRAPFCVLRIGDFYNTKICINSISISYDTGNGIQWDLNPEGIGLQPLIANIDMQFTFLGGSDLSGPISRLQNAVSYNYYANTSVYDRRSDYREGFVTPKDDSAMSWSPTLISQDNNKNVTEHRNFYTRNPGDSGDGRIEPLTDK